MTFTGYGSTKRALNTYKTKPDLSGSAYSTDSTQYDVSKNIYDLAGNVYEYTLRLDPYYGRTNRGGAFANDSFTASSGTHTYPNNSDTGYRISVQG